MSYTNAGHARALRHYTNELRKAQNELSIGRNVIRDIVSHTGHAVVIDVVDTCRTIVVVVDQVGRAK